MIPYRVLKRLDTGHMPGDIIDGNRFRRLDVLVLKGALAKAMTPPLTELPGWATRAEKLATIGVITVEDLLSMNPQKGTGLFGHKRASTFVKWVEEAKGWLTTPKPKSG